MKISIRFVLLLSFLALIWGTFFLTTTSSQLTSEQVLEQHAQVILENISSYAMEQSQNYLSKAQRATELTKSLLHSRVLVEDNGPQLESYFLEQLTNYPDIAGIYLGTPDGDFYYVSRNDKHSPQGFRTKIISHQAGGRQVHYLWRDNLRKLILDESDPADTYDPRVRPWYHGAMETDGIFWTDPYIFFTSQNPGITISGPTYTQEGKIRGIVGVDIEIDQLSTFISRLRIGTNGRAFMLDRNRDVVAFYDVEQIKFKGLDGQSSSRLVKIDEFQDPLSRKAFEALGIAQQRDSQILLSQAEHAEFSYQGETYLAMFTPFPDPQWPWIVGMYMPEDDYLGALKENRIDNYLLTFGISVVASILILFISHSISGPIIGLRRYAEKISAGRFEEEEESDLVGCRFREVSETAIRFDGLLEDLGRERTERQRAEASLRLKEDQYAALVENLKVGVFRVSQKGEILSANLAFAQMAGCETVAELKRNNIIGLYHNVDDHSRLVEVLRTYGQIANWELQLRPIAQQQPIWVSLHGTLKGTSPESYVEGLIEDISQRKQAEEQLIVSERMAAVGTLASGVAHEFNNIHAGVLGYAELGLHMAELPEKARSYFEQIKSSALRSRDLTANLVSCSGSPSRMTGADLNAILRESLAQVESELVRDGVEVEVALGQIPPFTMDRNQVGQLLLNLLSNARHAMLGCSLKKLRLSSGVEQNDAWVQVEDSGCGIPEDRWHKIFTPFFSTKGEFASSGSLQSEVKGAGLGLAVCHSIAKNHAGRITVDSRVDLGSSFTLFLPLRNSGMSPLVEPIIEAPRLLVNGLCQGRILVIEDQVEVGEMIGRALSGKGYEVEMTDDGHEALRFIRTRKIDLVLVDLQMPKMSGVDFLSQMQLLDVGQRPQVLIITGNKPDTLLSDQIDKAVFGTLIKPFLLDDLQAMVQAALQQQRRPKPDPLRAQEKVRFSCS